MFLFANVFFLGLPLFFIIIIMLLLSSPSTSSRPLSPVVVNSNIFTYTFLFGRVFFVPIMTKYTLAINTLQLQIHIHTHTCGAQKTQGPAKKENC